MGPLPRLRVRLLGGLSVDGLDEREIGSRKGRTVLKLLALARGGSVPPDRMVEVLWGDDPPSRPLNQLGVLVSRLGAVLGAERLPRSDAGYALRCDWLDVDELEARVVEAKRRLSTGQAGAARAAAQAGLALVRGPLLPDEEGDWIDAERAAADRLSQRARLVLGRRPRASRRTAPTWCRSSPLGLDHRVLSQRGLSDPGLAADEHQPTDSLRGSSQPHVEVSSAQPARPPGLQAPPNCAPPGPPRCTNCRQAQAACTRRLGRW